MKQGCFSLLQLRPVPEREEGLNVGVVLVSEGEIIVDHLAESGLIEVIKRLRLPPSDLAWIKQDLEAMAHRLVNLEDKTQEGLRHFGACEAGQIVLMPLHSTLLDEPERELVELFQQLVVPR